MQDFGKCFALAYPELVLVHSSTSIIYGYAGECADLKWLAGNHIVQRVPPTERNGRMHTSVVGCAVYTIPEMSTEELDIEFSYCHTKIKAGGMNTNSVQSTVRAKDKKTGITVRIDGRDQKHNKRKAAQILKEKVSEISKAEQMRKIRQEVLSDIRSNSRGGRDFTWSFRDDFVTNHKTGCQHSNLKSIFRGGLERIK